MGNTINISDFFTNKKEYETVWIDLYSFGAASGIQVIVIYIDSPKGEIPGLNFLKARKELDTMTFKDDSEEIAKMREMMVNLASGLIVDFKSADGHEITVDDVNKATLEDIKTILLPNCDDFVQQIVDFSYNKENFL